MASTVDTLPGNGLARWGVAAMVAVALVAIFSDPVWVLVGAWTSPPFRHAYALVVIPVTAWLVCHKWRDVADARPVPSWTGVGVVVLGLLATLVGELSGLYQVLQYALLLTLAGIGLTLVGWRGMVALAPILVPLAFVVPLPIFIHNHLFGLLDGLTADLGVALMRRFGVSVLLQGNVIDFGVHRIDVVEACGGVRLLVPFLALAYLAALVSRGPIAGRIAVFLAATPILIVVNSLGIAVTGLLVRFADVATADRFFQLFGPWPVFAVAALVLVGALGLLARQSGRRVDGRRSIGRRLLRWPRFPSSGRPRLSAGPFLAAAGLVILAAPVLVFVTQRSDVAVDRESLESFPMRLGGWHGQRRPLNPTVEGWLHADDHVLANYRRAVDREPVNLWAVYYGSQRKGGRTVHSPRSCIPGDGWRIAELRTVSTAAVRPDGDALRVNRVVVDRGAARMLVYYWFQQRGRAMTDEFHVKGMIFWDALTRRRTDGALVRLVTAVAAHESIEDAERRLADLAAEVYPLITTFVPD